MSAFNTNFFQKPAGQSGFLADLPTTIDKNNPLAQLQVLGENQMQLNLGNAAIQANLNRYNQSNPYGSQTWSQTPDGRFQLSTNLSASQNALKNQAEGLQSQYGDWLGSAQKKVAGLLGSVPTANEDYRNQVRSATFNQLKSDLDPQWTQDEANMRQDLEQRKIPVGSELYNKVMDNFQRNKSNAYMNASNQSIQSAEDAINNQYSRDMQRYQLPMQQLGQIGSLYQGIGGSKNPQFEAGQPIALQDFDLMGAGQGLMGMQNQKDIAAANNLASIKSAGIGANASLNAARLSADTQRYIADQNAALQRYLADNSYLNGAGRQG